MNGEETDVQAPESLVGLIDALAEPPEPAPVPLTPETWGWAAIGLLLLALIAVALWRWTEQRRANAYRRAALVELTEAESAADVAAILRRAALAAWPREDVASLTGDDWRAFLARTGRGGFLAEAGAELNAATYREETAPPSPELRRAAENWLSTHRATPAPTSARPKEEAPA